MKPKFPKSPVNDGHNQFIGTVGRVDIYVCGTDYVYFTTRRRGHQSYRESSFFKTAFTRTDIAPYVARKYSWIPESALDYATTYLKLMS